jgi:RNA polymerase sigma factor (TIGR02999 family)
MPELAEEIRTILEARVREEEPAFDELMSQLYAEMRRLARGQLRWRAQPGGLGTTSLVHEAYLKLANRDQPYRDQNHFFAVAARTMRHIVIDHARRRSRQKRGAGQVELPLHDERIAGDVPGDAQAARFLEIDEALEQLERVDPRLVKVVECLFFAGLTEKETAEILGVTERTVQRDWRRAKGWLREILRS